MQTKMPRRLDVEQLGKLVAAIHHPRQHFESEHELPCFGTTSGPPASTRTRHGPARLADLRRNAKRAMRLKAHKGSELKLGTGNLKKRWMRLFRRKRLDRPPMSL